MNFTDREKENFTSYLFVFFWQKAEHFVFIVSIVSDHKKMTQGLAE